MNTGPEQDPVGAAEGSMTQERAHVGPLKDVGATGALQPNMLLANARATSSTFNQVNFDHSVIHDSTYANSLFAQVNLTGAAFAFCAFDGVVVERSSLRNVELRECDVHGLTVNGFHVGALIERLIGEEE